MFVSVYDSSPPLITLSQLLENRDTDISQDSKVSEDVDKGVQDHAAHDRGGISDSTALFSGRGLKK